MMGSGRHVDTPQASHMAEQESHTHCAQDNLARSRWQFGDHPFIRRRVRDCALGPGSFGCRGAQGIGASTARRPSPIIATPLPKGERAGGKGEGGHTPGQ